MIVNNILTMTNGKGSGQIRFASPLFWQPFAFPVWQSGPLADLTESSFDAALIRESRSFLYATALTCLELEKLLETYLFTR